MEALALVTNCENFHIAKRLTRSNNTRRRHPDYVDPSTLSGPDEEVSREPGIADPLHTASSSNDNNHVLYDNSVSSLDSVYLEMWSRCDREISAVAQNIASKFSTFPVTSSSHPQLTTLPKLTIDSINGGFKRKEWTSSIPSLLPALSSSTSAVTSTTTLTRSSKMTLLTNLAASLREPYTPPPARENISPLSVFPTLIQVSQFWSLNLKQDAVFRKLGAYLLTRILEPTRPIDPPRVIVVGEGGVGKSRIVSALKSLCKQYGCEDSIAVMAPSGIAAVAIGGSTCDSLCKLNIRGDKISLEASTSWDRILLVVLDEFSMCGQVKLAKIDSHLRKLKSKNSDFGGLGFVLMGDHFQQLPVKDSALWIKPEVPTKFARSKKDAADVVFINQMNGYRLYMTFTECFYLTETNRFSDDPVLGWYLSNARYGLYSVGFRQLIYSRALTAEHWERLSSLPLPPVIGTHANKFRYHIINAFIAERSTFQSSESNPTYRLFAKISPVKNKTITTETLHSIYSVPPNDCNYYHPVLDVYVGMPILVTQNISVEIGIANGSQAVVREIVFDSSTTFSLVEAAGGAFVKIPSRRPIYIVVKIEDCKYVCNFAFATAGNFLL